MVAKTYKIRIAREGIEFEAEGDKAFVLAMLKRFDGDSAATASSGKEAARSSKSKAAKPGSVGPSKSMSIREFVQQLGPKKHTDITLTFGYYLEHFSEAKTFTGADINACYYDAKIEASNTSQMIIQNIRRGFMMEAKDKEVKGRKRYTLTRSGEDFIEKQLNATS
jgi:hypothetical protein